MIDSFYRHKDEIKQLIEKMSESRVKKYKDSSINAKTSLVELEKFLVKLLEALN